MKEESDKELMRKIYEHRKDTHITCSEDCWCWSAVGTICLYELSIQVNKLLINDSKETE